MHQGLKELAPEGIRHEARKAELLELGPVLYGAVEVVDDEPKQDKRQRTVECGTDGGPLARSLLGGAGRSAEKRTPQRKKTGA